jgi:hypothetical protein
MSQPVVYLLLFVALVLPVPAAFAVRLLVGRGAERSAGVLAVGSFVLAIAGVLMLAQANVPLLRVGSLTLFLPSTRLSEAVVAAPAEDAPAAPPAEAAPPTLPTLTPRPSITPRPSATPSPSPTREPSATPAPSATATPEPSATPEPQAGPQTYTVQAGDTFRAIAERFNVSVAELLEANDLTPAQADSLRVGQELIIP